MWIVAGLGNPGREYAGTRHNAGFMVVDELAEELNISFRKKGRYQVAEGAHKDQRLILIKPLTFMNLSGLVVAEVVRCSGASPGTLIVIHDDLDLPIGRVKIRKKGSSGGHKGVQSIIENLGTNGFIRVKVGIGKPVHILPESYVLEKFLPEESPFIKEAVKTASGAVLDILENGVERAMNLYNRGEPSIS